MPLLLQNNSLAESPTGGGSSTLCVSGMADVYPCENTTMHSRLPLADMGGGSGNDIWGWTDSSDGSEYALVGRTSGTSFVDITDPENPVYLGNLPTHTANSTWRDIKIYGDYAYIVSEAGGHGMQIFDLTQLRSVVSPPVTFTNSAHYNGFGSAHNIVINEDSGYAFGVGTNTCSGGLHMLDLSSPLAPVFDGCFSADGYTHDAQCVIYAGPDADHSGSEICLNSNEDTLTIVDVTTKSAPVQLSREGYAGVGYAHQGALTEDHSYFLMDDEGDELSFGHDTRTYIWDVRDLDNPILIGNFTNTTASSDHNQYILGNLSYQGNYQSGLRILDVSDVSNGNLTEVAYFDTFPANDNAGFNGVWSIFPYFESGNIIISDQSRGLFVVSINDTDPLELYLPIISRP